MRTDRGPGWHTRLGRRARATFLIGARGQNHEAGFVELVERPSGGGVARRAGEDRGTVEIVSGDHMV